MRILTLVPNLVPDEIAGGRRVALDLNHGYRKEGYDCKILTFGRSTEKMKNRYNVEGIEIQKIPTPSDHAQYNYLSVRTLPTHFFYSQASKLSSIFSKYDLIHIHNLHSIRLLKDVIKAKEESGKPIVWTVHDYWFCCPRNTIIDNHQQICDDYECFQKCYRDKKFIWKYSINRKKDTKLLQKLDLIIPPSKFMKDRLVKSGFDKNKIKLIYNGIPDIPYNKKIKRDSKDILYIGTPWPHKGVGVLLEALNSLKDLGHKFTLHILGNIGPTPEIRNRINTLKLKRNVKIHGFVSQEEKSGWLSKAGILVLPSIWPENCSIVLLEGLRAGIPIITTKMGGNPELVIHGQNGIICPPNNKEELINAILKIKTNKEYANELGKKGRKRFVERFTSKEMVNKYLKSISGRFIIE